MLLADFTNDTWLDLVVCSCDSTSGKANVLTGNDETFTVSTSLTVPVPGEPVLADLNAAGNLDLMVPAESLEERLVRG